MITRFRRHLRINLLALLMVAGGAQHAFPQGRSIVDVLSGFNGLDSKTNSLGKYLPQGYIPQYDYLISYIEINKIYGNAEHSGSIFIKGDSVIRHYRNKPTIIGDLFARDPIVKDSASEGFVRIRASRQEKKWIKKVDRLNGFYCQNTNIGNKDFYPSNRVRYLVIANKSSAYFGFIKYGPYDVDYAKMAQGEADVLKSIIDDVF